MSTNEASTQFFDSLKIEKNYSLTVSQQLRNIINQLAAELPTLILKPAFYKDIFKAIDADDKKLQNSVEIFMMIISIVGEEKSEKFLTERVKTV